MKLSILTCKSQENFVADSITMLTANGILVNLKNHEPYIATIKNSIVSIKNAQKNPIQFFIYKGVVHILGHATMIYAKNTDKITDTLAKEAKEHLEYYSHLKKNNTYQNSTKKHNKEKIEYLMSLTQALQTNKSHHAV